MSAFKLPSLKGTAVQDAPKDGEHCVHCQHNTRIFNFFKAEQLVEAVRSDGTKFPVRWFAACNECIAIAGGDINKVPFVNDGIWNTGTLPYEKILNPATGGFHN